MRKVHSIQDEFSTIEWYSSHESQWLLHNAKSYREGFRQALVDFKPDLYCVANFYDDARSAHYYEDKFSRFDLRLGQALLGRKFREKPWDRPRWVAVPERATSIHYNVLCRVSPVLLDNFRTAAPPIWKKLVPSGEFYLSPEGTSQEEDDEKLGSYSVKAFSPITTIDRTILNWTSWPQK